MRIDPKSYTLDAMDRADIIDALAARYDALSHTLDRKRRSRSAHTDRVRMEIESLETARARAEDLIGLLRGDRAAA